MCYAKLIVHFIFKSIDSIKTLFPNPSESLFSVTVQITLNIIISIFLLGTVYGQHDSLPYTLYRDKIVLYGDLGFSVAPFSIKDNFVGGYNKIQYKHNYKSGLGLGIIYNWFALRLRFSLPGNMRPISKFGKSNYTDLGVSFQLKKWYFDLDLRSYRGYSIKNANRWNHTLNELYPNDIRSQIRVVSFSANSWYFFNKHLKMPAVLGKAGHYNKEVKTWYLKSTVNFFGVADNGPLVPDELTDTLVTRSSANLISALDLGGVPGYAYVNHFNHWKVTAFAGIGGVIQAKFFSVGSLTRGFIGLAPRFDLRFITGYSKPSYFVWFVTDFDIKSIRHQEMRYLQTYYTLRLVGGVRLTKKEKKSMN